VGVAVDVGDDPQAHIMIRTVTTQKRLRIRQC
jgi:hypothetical protein